MENNFLEWINTKKTNSIHNEVISNTLCSALLDNIKGLLYPGFVDNVEDLSCYIDCKIASIKNILMNILKRIESIECLELDKESILNNFLNELPVVEHLLATDLKALYDGDPAAKSEAEIILCYPGFNAIFTYRIAHILYSLSVPILPRFLSESAHSLTGIDIHPGAKIDEYFFIDHGTGIVIGETCEIGKHVKIYQGVTLGALSLSAGQKLKGCKRHPTVKDNVTIYSGASIFGGDTVIGENTTIGSNAFITESVESNIVVTIEGQKKKRSLS